MMPRMHPSAVLSSGFLLLSTGLSSCTFLPMFSSGGQETPRTLGARMEKHTEVLQKDIGARNASQPKSMEAAAKYIAGNFSDMGYAVTMQPVSGGNVKKGAAIYNILVYKPGLYSNNQSIVVGANYDSSGRRNNGSGTALLLETARGLKDIPTNHNIYFVAYANGAEPAGKSISSGACVHAGTLSGSIGATNILGMINLEPQKLEGNENSRARKPPGKPFCSRPPRTARNLQASAPPPSPNPGSRRPLPSTGNLPPSQAMTAITRSWAFPRSPAGASIPSRMPVRKSMCRR